MSPLIDNKTDTLRTFGTAGGSGKSLVASSLQQSSYMSQSVLHCAVQYGPNITTILS